MNFLRPSTCPPRNLLSTITLAILTMLIPLTGTADSTILPADSPGHERPRLLLPVAESPQPSSTPLRTPALRPSGTLKLNPSFERNQTDWLQVGRQLRLDLLENQDITLQIDAVRTLEDGTTHVLGRSPENPGSHIHMMLDQSQLSGFAHIPSFGTFTWNPAANGQTQVTQQPPNRAHWCATDILNPTAVEASRPSNSVERQTIINGVWDPTTEPTSVDILVLFTADAAAAEGSDAALTEHIHELVARASRTFTNSLIGIRLNPVYIGRIDHLKESGNIITDASFLATDAQVAALRKDYKADLVYLIVEVDTVGFLGFATMVSNQTEGNPQRAYSVMRRAVISGYPRGFGFDSLIFTHETAHMFGAGHDVEHGFPSPFQGQAPAYPYGNGYRFAAGGTTYRTVMSYDPGIQLSLFSNPNLTFARVPLGVAGQADNTQALNRMAGVVARYTAALSRIEFAQPSLTVTEGDGSIRLTLTRTGDLKAATQVKVVVDKASTATALQDHSLSPSTSIFFSSGQSTAEVIIPLLQDAELEGDEVLKLSLSGVTGNHGLGQVSHCTITVRDDEPAFVLSTTSAVLKEADGEIDVTVEFTGALTEGNPVETSLVVGQPGDSASANDFEVTPRQLTFSAGQRQQTFRIRAQPDDLAEADETAQLSIGNAQLTVRLLDDDRPGTLLPVAIPNGSISALKALPDGGVLAAGTFTRLDGIRRTGVVRLNANGQVDPNFNPPELLTATVQDFTVPPAEINCVLPDSRGRLVLGGFIALADGRTVHNLVRLEADGRLDTTFQPPKLDGSVWSLAEQPDGKILVGGAFDHVGTQNIRGLTRLNPDGSLDSGFHSTPGFGGIIVFGSAVGVLPEGKILVGGILSEYHGTNVFNLVRLNPDGSLDRSFPLLETGTSAEVDSIAVLPDGRAYLSGFFEFIGGQPHRRLARLKADGTVDPTFRSSEANAEIYHVHPLPNGQVLVGGMFARIGGSERRYVALLNEDGTLDTRFDLGRGAGDHVWNVTVAGDGSLYLGGVLQEFNDQPAPYLARLRLPPITGSILSPDLSGGEFKSRVYGLPGMSYPLESSIDLIHWQPAGEVQVERLDQTAPFAIPAAGTSQFLRLKP